MQDSTGPLQIWGLPTVGTHPAGGLAPLNASQVLQMCKNAGGSPLPYISRQGRRAKSSAPGGSQGVSNPDIMPFIKLPDCVAAGPCLRP